MTRGARGGERRQRGRAIWRRGPPGRLPLRTQSRTRVRRESPLQVPETSTAGRTRQQPIRAERQRPAKELVQHSSARGHVAGVPRAFAVIAVTARRHCRHSAGARMWARMMSRWVPVCRLSGVGSAGRRAASRAGRAHGGTGHGPCPRRRLATNGAAATPGEAAPASQGNSRRKMHAPPQWIHEVTPVSACYPRTVGASRRHAAECCWEAVTRAG